MSSQIKKSSFRFRLKAVMNGICHPHTQTDLVLVGLHEGLCANCVVSVELRCKYVDTSYNNQRDVHVIVKTIRMKTTR